MISQYIWWRIGVPAANPEIICTLTNNKRIPSTKANTREADNPLFINRNNNSNNHLLNHREGTAAVTRPISPAGPTSVGSCHSDTEFPEKLSLLMLMNERRTHLESKHWSSSTLPFASLPPLLTHPPLLPPSPSYPPSLLPSTPYYLAPPPNPPSPPLPAPRTHDTCHLRA